MYLSFYFATIGQHVLGVFIVFLYQLILVLFKSCLYYVTVVITTESCYMFYVAMDKFCILWFHYCAFCGLTEYENKYHVIILQCINHRYGLSKITFLHSTSCVAVSSNIPLLFTKKYTSCLEQTKLHTYPK
jgi:hypothetical protein